MIDPITPRRKNMLLDIERLSRLLWNADKKDTVVFRLPGGVESTIFMEYLEVNQEPGKLIFDLTNIEETNIDDPGEEADERLAYLSYPARDLLTDEMIASRLGTKMEEPVKPKIIDTKVRYEFIHDLDFDVNSRAYAEGQLWLYKTRDDLADRIAKAVLETVDVFPIRYAGLRVYVGIDPETFVPTIDFFVLINQ